MLKKVALEHAEKIIRPLAYQSFDMQRYSNTLGAVFLMFDSRFRGLVVDDAMIGVLEERWLVLEQPIYVLGASMGVQLSIVLPRIIAQLPAYQAFFISNLDMMAHVYYEKFIDPDLRKDVLMQFFKWMQVNQEDIAEMLFSVDQDIMLWLFQAYSDEENYGLLAKLATFILCAVVRSATCERLFKSCKLFHTVYRKRMNLGTASKLILVKRHQERVNHDGPGASGQGSVHILPGKNWIVLRTRLELSQEGENMVEMIQEEKDEMDNEEKDDGDIVDRFAHLNVDPKSIMQG